MWTTMQFVSGRAVRIEGSLPRGKAGVLYLRKNGKKGTTKEVAQF